MKMNKISKWKRELFIIACQQIHRRHQIPCNRMDQLWWVECHRVDRLALMWITIQVNTIFFPSSEQTTNLESQSSYLKPSQAISSHLKQKCKRVNFICFLFQTGNYPMHRINFGPPPPPPPIPSQGQRLRFTNRWMTNPRRWIVGLNILNWIHRKHSDLH